jgi:hypothetical protein
LLWVWQDVVRQRGPKMAVPPVGKRDMGATRKTLGSAVGANTLSFPMGVEAAGPEAKAVGPATGVEAAGPEAKAVGPATGVEAVDPAMAAELVGPGAEAGMLQAAVVSCREPE